MKRSTRTQEAPIEEMFTELEACLADVEEIRLPSLEAKVRDIRDVCKTASGILSRLEHRVVIQKRKR
jgi:hypothetical protein